MPLLVSPFPPPENPRPHHRFFVKIRSKHHAASLKSSMYRPVTPQISLRKPGQHYTTPRKATVLAAVDFCEKSNTSYFKEDVFRTFNVYQKRGYEWLRTGVIRRMHNDPKHEETRGRNHIISAEKIGEIECVLETEGIEVGLDCSGCTVERAMGTMNYHKYIACRKG